MNLREPHPCERCGTWIAEPNQRGKPQKFCSKNCRAGVHGVREYTCKECSRKWKAKSVPGYPPGYCSEDCRKEAARARALEWYYANPERAAAQPSRDPEVRKARWAAYYEANREAMIARVVEYSRTHPEMKRAYDAARYARTRGSVGSERFTLDEIFARDEGVCYLCLKDCPRETATMDHVIPAILGGPHTRVNVRLACKRCNSRKKAALIPEGFYAEGVEVEDQLSSETEQDNGY